MITANNLQEAITKGTPIFLGDAILLRRLENPSYEIKESLKGCQLDKVIDKFVLCDSSDYKIKRESYNEITVLTKKPINIITGFEIKNDKKQFIVSKLSKVRFIVEDTYLYEDSISFIDIIGRIEDVWPILM